MESGMHNQKQYALSTSWGNQKPNTYIVGTLGIGSFQVPTMYVSLEKQQKY